MSLVHNELHTQLLGIAAINPLVRSDAAARQQMVGGHVSQALVIEDASTRRLLGGFERELGKTTFSVKMPVDAEVLQVIEKFPRTVAGKRADNPLTLILFEDVHTKELGVVEVGAYHCLHQHFGFRYKRNAHVNPQRGDNIQAGTILADSPAKDKAGNACLGTEATVAFMSVPGVIEDGVIISRTFARRLGVMGYEKRDMSWGQDWYPLNTYGDEHQFKIFPDVGERIHDTGLLMGTRRFDEKLDVIGMAPSALRTPDHHSDRLRYGKGDAKVVDISVIYEPKNNQKLTPVGMDEQMLYYYEAERKFHQTLWEAYEKLKKVRRDTLKLSRRLHVMLVEARNYLAEKPKGNIKRMYQHEALDEWRVEVTYEYLAIPHVPFKLTDFHGGKGVICAVWDDDRMPIDEEGNRADIIMDGDSTIKRMNVGRMYEQYLNATSRTVTNHVRAMFGGPTQAELDAERYGWLTPEQAATLPAKKQAMATAIAQLQRGQLKDQAKQAWEYLLGYYQITSPLMYQEMTTGTSTNPAQHTQAILEDGVYLFFPTDNPVYYPDMVSQMRERYPVHRGPVSYVGDSGRRCTTRANVLLGSLYIMLLEKTGDDHSGVASAKTQHFGIPACLTKYDKHSSASRSNPVRIAGESEVRLMAATIGGDKTAELLDLSCSPASHKAVCRAILRSANPTAIPLIIDRNENPMGGNRPLSFANHMLECGGLQFYVPDVQDIAPTIYRDEVGEGEDVDEGLEMEVEVESDEGPVPPKATARKLITTDVEEENDDETEDDEEETESEPVDEE